VLRAKHEFQISKITGGRKALGFFFPSQSLIKDKCIPVKIKG
jgi:hypothetical protein